MKGFFSWFKSENKIKRWLFLILVSMIAICYAMSTIFVTESLNITSVFKIVILFILGFSGIVFSVVSIQKRTLELLVKETDKIDNLNYPLANIQYYQLFLLFPCTYITLLHILQLLL